jgi:hypothetical protein
MDRLLRIIDINADKNAGLDRYQKERLKESRAGIQRYFNISARNDPDREP